MLAPVNQLSIRPEVIALRSAVGGLSLCATLLAGLDAIVLPPAKGAIRVHVQELGEFLRNLMADR